MTMVMMMMNDDDTFDDYDTLDMDDGQLVVIMKTMLTPMLKPLNRILIKTVMTTMIMI